VHPPPFPLGQRLSDWPDCRLELHCCRGQSVLPVRLMLRDHSDRTFAQVLAKLRCQKCHRPPAPVYLCAGHREFSSLNRAKATIARVETAGVVSWRLS
jgi:hypothetical protein